MTPEINVWPFTCLTMYMSCFSFWHHDGSRPEVHGNPGAAATQTYHLTTTSTWSEVMHLHAASFAFNGQRSEYSLDLKKILTNEFPAGTKEDVSFRAASTLNTWRETDRCTGRCTGRYEPFTDVSALVCLLMYIDRNTCILQNQLEGHSETNSPLMKSHLNWLDPDF